MRRAAALLLLALASLPLLTASSRPVRPNVVVICIDGCRPDHLGAYGYARPTSPCVDEKAREGVVFLHNYAQANESLYSHASLFSSRYPTEIGSFDYERYRLPADLTTLPKVLTTYGYQTAGFVGGGHIASAFGFGQGFDVYEDSLMFNGFSETVPKAVTWMRAHRQQPMFVFLHGYDVHSPYYSPTIFRHCFDAGYRGPADDCLRRYTMDRMYNGVFYPQFRIRLQETADGQTVISSGTYPDLAALVAQNQWSGLPLAQPDIDHIIAHYDSSVRYADTWLGLFFSRMRGMGLDASNTMVVILADHGEDLMDHGYFNHRCGLQSSNVHVPLVFWGWGVGRGRRCDMVSQNLDVAPTILSMLGCSVPQQMRGQSLALQLKGEEAPHEETALAQGVLDMTAVFDRDHELIAHGARPGSPAMRRLLASDDAAHFELYDLRSDPLQKINLAGQPQALQTLRRLRSRLLDMETQASSPQVLPRRPLDPRLLQELRDHGYW